jgi:hypothetical protein
LFGISLILVRRRDRVKILRLIWVLILGIILTGYLEVPKLLSISVLFDKR